MSAITTEITEYSETASALAEFATKYKGVVYAVATPAGMRQAIEARRELRDSRVALEKRRKEIKEPALRRCQLIDSEAKRITAELESLEGPIDAQIKAEEERKEREKREAIEREQRRIEYVTGLGRRISQYVADVVGKSSAAIREQAGKLRAWEPDHTLMTEAEVAAFNVVSAEASVELDRMAEAAEAQEAEQARMAAERAELDRQQAALAVEREALERAQAEARAAQEAAERAQREAAEREAAAIRAREPVEHEERVLRAEREAAEVKAREEAEARRRAEAQQAEDRAAHAAAIAKAEAEAEERRLMSMNLVDAANLALSDMAAAGLTKTKGYRALSAAIKQEIAA